MQTPLILCLCAAVATAITVWPANQERTYHLHIRHGVGQPEIEHSFAALFIKARLDVQVVSPQTLLVKIRNPYASSDVTELYGGFVNTNLPGWETSAPFRGSTPPANTKWIQALEASPIKINLDSRGEVKNFQVAKDVDTHIVNVYRAIISSLQVTSKVQDLKPDSPDIFNPRNTYKSMEEQVEGECVNTYEWIPLSEEVVASDPSLIPVPQACSKSGYNNWEIIKTTNFSNCEWLPVYDFGLPARTQCEPGSAACGTFATRASVTRYTACASKEGVVIQRIIDVNQITVNPFLSSSEKSVALSIKNFTLIGTGPISKPISFPSNTEKYSSLVYDFNEAEELVQDRSPETSSRSKISQSYLGSYHPIAGRHVPYGQYSGPSWALKSGQYDYEYSDEDSESDSDSSSSEEDDDNQQPHPTLKYPPMNPLLPFFVGFEGNSIQTKLNIPNTLISLIETIAEEIMDPSEMPDKNTLQKVQMAVRLARVASTKQLLTVANKLFSVDSSSNRRQQAARKITRDILAMAGTNPAFMAIKELILSKQLNGIKAAMVVATLPKSMRTPTVELLEEWLDLAQKLQSPRSRQLRMTTVLALARITNNVCVHPTMPHNRYPVHAFGRFCSPNNQFVTSKLIPQLAQKLQQSSDSRWQMTWGRALAIIGHEAALPALEKILEGERNDVSDTVRAVIILSMKPMVQKNPKLMAQVLVKIFHNTDEDYVVRSAAFLRLITKDISLTLLQRLASSTWWEPNNQVAELITSTIKSLDRQNLPYQLKELSKKASQVVHLLRPTVRGIQRSHTLYHSNQLKNPKVGLVTKTTWLGSDDSIYPTALIHTVRKRVGGLNLQPLKVTALLSSPSDWYDELDDILDDTDDESSSSESGEDNPAQQILEKLGITEDETEDLEGFLNFKLNNAMDYTMPFNNETLYEIVDLIRKHEGSIEKGQSFNFQKLINRKQITKAVPSGLGIPVVYKLATPTLVIVRGEIQADAKPDLSSADEGELKVPDNVEAIGKLEVVFASTKMAKLLIVDPIESDVLVTGVNKEIQAYLPIQFNIDIDLDDENMKLRVKPLKTNPELVLFTYDVEPYVAVKDIENLKPAVDVKRSDTLEARDKPLKKSFKFGKQSLGLAFELEQETDSEFLDMESYMQVLRQKSPMAFLHLPFVSNSVRNTEVTLTLNLQSSQTKSVLIVADHDDDETPDPTYTVGDSGSTEENFSSMRSTHWKITNVDSDSSESDESDSSESESDSESNSSSDESNSSSSSSSDESDQRVSRPGYGKRQSISFAKFGPKSFQRTDLKHAYSSPYEKYQPSQTQPLSEQRRKYVLKNLLQGTKGSEAHILDIYVGLENANDHVESQLALTLAASTAITNDDDNLYAAYLTTTLNKDQQQYEVCLEVQEDPASLALLDLKDVLDDDPTSKIKINAAYGRKCSEGAELNIRAIMRQSQRREQEVRRSPVVKQCLNQVSKGYDLDPSCRNATYRAGLTDEVLISAQWNKMHPVVANVSRRVLQTVQSSLLSQTSVQYLDLIGRSNPSGHAQLKVKFHPKLWGVNVTVSTPQKNVFFNNLRIPHQLRPVLPYHPTYDWVDSYMSKITKLQYTPFCIYDDDKVHTFDNVTYKYNLHDSYHLLVADTSEDGEDVAVLAKDDKNENKVLVVVTDEVEVKVVPDVNSPDEEVDSFDDFKVYVNNREIDIKEDTLYVKKDKDDEEILYIYPVKGGVIVVELPDKDIVILHNGDGLAINFDNSYRDDVSGLCGNFDGEPVGEFETASGCVVSDAKQFASSYNLGTSKMSYVASVPGTRRTHTQSRSQSCPRPQRHYADAVDDYIIKRVTSCSNTKTRVISQGNNLCFSEVPLIQCGMMCEPSEVHSKEVNFICYPQGHEARALAQKARAGQTITQFRGESKHVSRTIQLPRGCVSRRG